MLLLGALSSTCSSESVEGVNRDKCPRGCHWREQLSKTPFPEEHASQDWLQGDAWSTGTPGPGPGHSGLKGFGVSGPQASPFFLLKAEWPQRSHLEHAV